MSPLEHYFEDLLKSHDAMDAVVVRDDAATTSRIRNHGSSSSLKRTESRNEHPSFGTLAGLKSSAPSCPSRKLSGDNIFDAMRRSITQKHQTSRNRRTSRDFYSEVMPAGIERSRRLPRKRRDASRPSNTEENVNLVQDILSAVKDLLEMEKHDHFTQAQQDHLKEFQSNLSGIVHTT